MHNGETSSGLNVAGRLTCAKTADTERCRVVNQRSVERAQMEVGVGGASGAGTGRGSLWQFMVGDVNALE